MVREALKYGKRKASKQGKYKIVGVGWKMLTKKDNNQNNAEKKGEWSLLFNRQQNIGKNWLDY